MIHIAGPPYRAESQWHGPCYVLSPEDYEHGWREVLAILPAIPRRPPGRVRIYIFSRPMRSLEPEPGWHIRARELRARGLSVRAVMRELGIRNRFAMDRALNKLLYG